MADQIMKVDGDFKPYVNAAKGAENATKRVAKEAGGIGDAVAKSIVKIEILKMGLSKAVQLLTQINALNTDAAKGRDDRAMRVSTAASSLGIEGSGLISRLENRKGKLSTSAQSMSFLESLASSQKSANVKMSAADASESVDLFEQMGEMVTGAGGSDFIKMLSDGRSPKESARRLLSEQKNAGQYQEYYGAVNRQNQADQATFNDQARRGAAGAEQLAFDNFNKRERGGAGELINQLVPDFVQKKYHDVNQRLGGSLGIDTGPTYSASDSVDNGETAQYLRRIADGLDKQTGIIQKANAPTPNNNAEVSR